MSFEVRGYVDFATISRVRALSRTRNPPRWSSAGFCRGYRVLLYVVMTRVPEFSQQNSSQKRGDGTAAAAGTKASAAAVEGERRGGWWGGLV